jgi:hypothetical protein
MENGPVVAARMRLGARSGALGGHDGCTGRAHGWTAGGGRKVRLGFVVVGLDGLLFGFLVGYRCIRKNLPEGI